MVGTYPVPPLLSGHPLAIGVTSYDGKVFYGVTADRDWLPDAELLGTCIREALVELRRCLHRGSAARPAGSQEVGRHEADARRQEVPVTRIYVPTTLAGLAGYVDHGYVPESAERYAAPGDDEESEYAALEAAAEAAESLLTGPGRRVVLVAEVTFVDGPVAMEQVVAVHADTDDEHDPDDELAWFATQEIQYLI